MPADYTHPVAHHKGVATRNIPVAKDSVRVSARSKKKLPRPDANTIIVIPQNDSAALKRCVPAFKDSGKLKISGYTPDPVVSPSLRHGKTSTGSGWHTEHGQARLETLSNIKKKETQTSLVVNDGKNDISFDLQRSPITVGLHQSLTNV